MIKKIIIGILMVLILCAGAAAAVVSYAVFFKFKNIVEYVTGQALGASVKIGDIKTDLKNRKIYLNDFKIYNPKGFDEKKVLAYVAQVRGDFNADSLVVNKKLHFVTLDIYVKVMEVTKNKDGKLNVEELKIIKEPFEELPLSVDSLILTSDYVVYQDFSKGEKGAAPHIEAFEVHIKNAAYKGFPSLEDIAGKVVSEILAQTTIKGAAAIGAAMVGGAVGGWAVVIPAEAVILMSSKDSYRATFGGNYDEAYEASLETARELGRNIFENRESGIIKGFIDDAASTIIVEKAKDGKVYITVSSRRFFMPKPSIAGGILYDIAIKINKDDLKNVKTGSEKGGAS